MTLNIDLGILHVQAVANERAGIFFAARKETSWATTYLTRAFLLYKEWGGHAKACQMVSRYADLIQTNPEGHRSSISLRARERMYGLEPSHQS